MDLAPARIGSVVAVLALAMAFKGGPGAAQSPSERQSSPGTSPGAVAITNVTVIDVLGGAGSPP